jgi:predicted DsbA family dithiol-disulfide isomerase
VFALPFTAAEDTVRHPVCLICLVLALTTCGCRTTRPGPIRTTTPMGSLVHDPDTNRVWSPWSPRAVTDDQAETWCQQMPPAGHWRLPYRHEVEQLFDGDTLRSVMRPLEPGVQFMHSGEAVPGRDPGHRWVANLFNGHVFNGHERVVHARCIQALGRAEEQALADQAHLRWERGLAHLRPGLRPEEGEAYSLGAPDAPVTIVLFYDFQCPYCQRLHGTLLTLLERDPRVRLVYKAAPIIPFHAHEAEAHAAVYAAGRQGRFSEMQGRMFAEARTFGAAPEETAFQLASELHLDLVAFEEDYRSDAIREQVAAETAQARALDVSGLPTCFINGTRLSGARNLEDMQAAVDEAVAAQD